MSRNANAQFFWDTLYDHDIENDDHNNGVDYVNIDIDNGEQCNANDAQNWKYHEGSGEQD